MLDNILSASVTKSVSLSGSFIFSTILTLSSICIGLVHENLSNTVVPVTPDKALPHRHFIPSKTAPVTDGPALNLTSPKFPILISFLGVFVGILVGAGTLYIRIKSGLIFTPSENSSNSRRQNRTPVRQPPVNRPPPPSDDEESLDGHDDPEEDPYEPGDEIEAGEDTDDDGLYHGANPDGDPDDPAGGSTTNDLPNRRPLHSEEGVGLGMLLWIAFLFCNLYPELRIAHLRAWFTASVEIVLHHVEKGLCWFRGPARELIERVLLRVKAVKASVCRFRFDRSKVQSVEEPDNNIVPPPNFEQPIIHESVIPHHQEPISPSPEQPSVPSVHDPEEPILPPQKESSTPTLHESNIPRPEEPILLPPAEESTAGALHESSIPTPQEPIAPLPEEPFLPLETTPSPPAGQSTAPGDGPKKVSTLKAIVGYITFVFFIYRVLTKKGRVASAYRGDGQHGRDQVVGGSDVGEETRVGDADGDSVGNATSVTYENEDEDGEDAAKSVTDVEEGKNLILGTIVAVGKMTARQGEGDAEAEHHSVSPPAAATPAFEVCNAPVATISTQIPPTRITFGTGSIAKFRFTGVPSECKFTPAPAPTAPQLIPIPPTTTLFTSSITSTPSFHGVSSSTPKANRIASDESTPSPSPTTTTTTTTTTTPVLIKSTSPLRTPDEDSPITPKSHQRPSSFAYPITISAPAPAPSFNINSDTSSSPSPAIRKETVLKREYSPIPGSSLSQFKYTIQVQLEEPNDDIFSISPPPSFEGVLSSPTWVDHHHHRRRRRRKETVLKREYSPIRGSALSQFKYTIQVQHDDIFSISPPPSFEGVLSSPTWVNHHHHYHHQRGLVRDFALRKAPLFVPLPSDEDEAEAEADQDLDLDEEDLKVDERGELDGEEEEADGNGDGDENADDLEDGSELESENCEPIDDGAEDIEGEDAGGGVDADAVQGDCPLETGGEDEEAEEGEEEEATDEVHDHQDEAEPEMEGDDDGDDEENRQESKGEGEEAEQEEEEEAIDEVHDHHQDEAESEMEGDDDGDEDEESRQPEIMEDEDEDIDEDEDAIPDQEIINQGAEQCYAPYVKRSKRIMRR